MIQIVFDDVLVRKLRRITKKDKRLARLIDKQLTLFEDDSSHPSLRKHKLKGKLGDYWSISIDESLRLIYITDGNIVCFVDCGTHDQVYRM